ncbi:MAG: ABC-2 transporter permease [Candidatus Cloacimonetes bacterium]|nr:ABC-2 transporter permease [Candidatus Cloacimonadota bacterium]
MIKLIKKDFISYWKFILIISGYIPFLVSIALWAMMDDFGGIWIGFFTTLSLALCIFGSLVFLINETHTNSEILYASLPVERSTIVMSKYVTAYILLCYSYILVILSTLFIFSVSGGNDKAFDLLLSIRGITMMFGFMIVVLSYILPFLLIFGMRKGAVINFIISLLFVMLKPVADIIENLFKGIVELNFSFIEEYFQSAVLFVTKLSAADAYTILLGTLVIGVNLSMMASIKFYSSRDLE